MRILSIDAWREPDGGWSWNAWFKVGEVSKAKFETLGTNREAIKFFRDEGCIGNESKGKVAIDDDGYNLVVMAKGTKRPLYAIEYGAEY